MPRTARRLCDQRRLFRASAAKGRRRLAPQVQGGGARAVHSRAWGATEPRARAEKLRPFLSLLRELRPQLCFKVTVKASAAVR